MAVASFATGVASNYMQLQGDLDKSKALEYEADRYRFKAERSRMAADAARTQTKLNNTILQENYNETQANDAVKYAMQGRSGATIANIIRQDEENLNWDKRFMELSGTIEATNLELESAGYEMDAASTDVAAAKGVQSAYKKSALGLLSSVTKTAKIL